MPRQDILRFLSPRLPTARVRLAAMRGPPPPPRTVSFHDPRQGFPPVGPLLLAACLAAPVTAQPKGIWADPVLPQPFDREPFRPIKVPAWVEDTIGCGYTLSGMDTKARTAAAAHGVTISELGFVDPFYAYYDSKLLKRRSPHVPLDRLPGNMGE